MVEQSHLPQRATREEGVDHAPRTDGRKSSFVDRLFRDLRKVEQRPPHQEDVLTIGIRETDPEWKRLIAAGVSEVTLRSGRFIRHETKRT